MGVLIILKPTFTQNSYWIIFIYSTGNIKCDLRKKHLFWG